VPVQVKSSSSSHAGKNALTTLHDLEVDEDIEDPEEEFKGALEPSVSQRSSAHAVSASTTRLPSNHRNLVTSAAQALKSLAAHAGEKRQRSAQLLQRRGFPLSSLPVTSAVPPTSICAVTLPRVAGSSRPAASGH